MTIIDTLKAEHKKVLGMMEELDATTDKAVKTREKLRADICFDLEGHAKGEEAVVYPAYKLRGDHDDLKSHAEAEVEHKAVEETVLPRVKNLDVATRDFAGAAKVLKEFVDHHAKEEEKTIFPSMKKLFTKEELTQMDADYLNWKKANGY